MRMGRTQELVWVSLRSNKMNDSLFELTVEKNHLSIIIKALSNYICSQYEGIDAEVVDVPKTMENIKIAADMQLVLKHHLEVYNTPLNKQQRQQG